MGGTLPTDTLLADARSGYVFNLQQLLDALGGSLTVTDGTHAVENVNLLTVSGATVGGASPNATLTVTGGGGNTITLPADTDIAAGTSASVNSSGHAVQTWGPAPQIGNTVTLLSGPLGQPFTPNGNPPVVIQLSSTLYVAFQPANNTLQSSLGIGQGAVAFTLSGNAITVGTPSSAGGLQNVQTAAAVSSTSFIFTYIDASGDLYVQAGSVSGTTISLGTAQEVAAGGKPINVGQSGLAVLSSTSAVYAYIDSSNQTWLIPIALSGTALTLGTPVDTNFPSDPGTYAAPLIISSTSFLVTFVNPTGGANTVSAMVGTVSGNAITLNTTATVPNTTGYWTAAVMLNGTTFALSWIDQFVGTLEQKVFSVIGSISGTTITFGTPVVTVNLSAPSTLSWTGTFSASQFWVFVAGTEPTLATVSGTSIIPTIGASIPVPFSYSAFGAPFNSSFSAGTNGYQFQPIVGVGSNLLWLDGLWSLYGETSTGVVSGRIDHPGIINYALVPIDATSALAVLMDAATNLIARTVNFEPINNGPIGFVNSTVSEGNPATIQTSGIVPDLTDQAGDPLAPGATYYHNGDGSIVTANTGHKAGVALTNSTLLIAA